MIKPEQTSKEFDSAIDKLMGKLRVRPYYGLNAKLYTSKSSDLDALFDYLSKASGQELQELRKHKTVTAFVKRFEDDLIKDLVSSTKLRKKAVEDQKKAVKLQKERQAKAIKERAERERLAKTQSVNLFSQLKLTHEQKAILKKMVDGQ